MTDKTPTEYDRGWAAAMRYVNDVNKVRYERNLRGGSFPFAIVLGVLTALFGFALIYPWVAFGRFDPWFLMVTLIGAVWLPYLRRSWRRDAAEIARLEAEFKAKWRQANDR